MHLSKQDSAKAASGRTLHIKLHPDYTNRPRFLIKSHHASQGSCSSFCSPWRLKPRMRCLQYDSQIGIDRVDICQRSGVSAPCVRWRCCGMLCIIDQSNVAVLAALEQYERRQELQRNLFWYLMSYRRCRPQGRSSRSEKCASMTACPQ